MRFLALLFVPLWLVAAADIDGDGSTPLLWAAYHNDREAVERLLKSGVDPSVANDLGATPLWAAAQNGSREIVAMLLKAGANPNAALLKGETPLMVAARGGYAEIVHDLAAKGANVNQTAARGQTALMWAVAQKHPGVVRVLIEHGANLHLRSAAWTMVMAVPPHGYREYNRAIPHGGDTALLFAARVGDLESARLLLAAGANVNDEDAWGVTPAVLAAHSGFRDLVELFLDKGANPNLAKAGFSALHLAILRRDEKLVAALLDHGADPNQPVATWTPVRRSAKDWYIHPALVGATPFWLAARFNEPGVMRLLAKRGADPKVVHTSTTVADRGYQKRTETSNALLAAFGAGGGNSWVQPPKSQRDALLVETVKVALELGADPKFKNNAGRTVMEAANALGNEGVTKLLKESASQ